MLQVGAYRAGLNVNLQLPFVENLPPFSNMTQFVSHKQAPVHNVSFLGEDTNYIWRVCLTITTVSLRTAPFFFAIPTFFYPVFQTVFDIPAKL